VLAISHVAVSREREVVVVDVEDRPGVLADLTRKVARAGVTSTSSTFATTQPGRLRLARPRRPARRARVTYRASAQGIDVVRLV